MIFQGAKFCSHCGARVNRTEVDPAVNISCPHCQDRLEAVSVGKTNLRECPKCEGLWMDNASFDQICADREEQSAVLGLATLLPNQVSAGELKVRYYPCPVCQALMNRVNFAHCSGVIVDICRTHGTWFDKDELRRIVEFIRGGGLDKARMIEIEELKRQREQLRSAQMTGTLDTANEWHHTVGWPGANHDLVGTGVSAAVEALFDFFSRR